MHAYQVGVVCYVARKLLAMSNAKARHNGPKPMRRYSPRSRTPVDDTSSRRSDEAVSVNVSHDIVASALLLKSCGGEFVVLNALVGLQLSNGFLRDVETKLTLRLGEVDPELSPGAETVARREDVLHLLRGVPRVEGADARVSIEPARHMPQVSKRRFVSCYG